MQGPDQKRQPHSALGYCHAKCKSSAAIYSKFLRPGNLIFPLRNTLLCLNTSIWLTLKQHSVSPIKARCWPDWPVGRQFAMPGLDATLTLRVSSRFHPVCSSFRKLQSYWWKGGRTPAFRGVSPLSTATLAPSVPPPRPLREKAVCGSQLRPWRR